MTLSKPFYLGVTHVTVDQFAVSSIRPATRPTPSGKEEAPPGGIRAFRRKAIIRWFA